MKTHELKCIPEFFRELMSGKKHFEIRYNDRNFQVGDLLHLREWDPHVDEKEGDGYSGTGMTRSIIYITRFEQKPGYVVLGLDPMDLNPAVYAQERDIQ